MTNFPVYKRAQLYCDKHREMNCGVCAESYLVEGIRIADRRIAELEQRLAELVAKIPRWIPVSERLPDKGQKVIAFYRNRAGFPCQIIAEYIHPRTRICEDFYDFDVDYEPDYDEETDTEWVKAGWIEHIYNWGDYSFVDVLHDVEFWMPRAECPVKEESGKVEVKE